jgi:hypothetical protein
MIPPLCFWWGWFCFLFLGRFLVGFWCGIFACVCVYFFCFVSYMFFFIIINYKQTK